MELFHFAKDLLNWFVDISPFMYGNTFVVYNVHNLIHLHEDVKKNQCGLEDMSAFQFENFLQRVKKMFRKTHQPVSRIAKRVKEMEESNYTYISKDIKTKVEGNKNNGRNSLFLLKNNKIGEFLGFKVGDNL